MQTIGQKRHHDVRFNSVHILVENGPDCQVPFHILESLLHLGELNIELPERL